MAQGQKQSNENKIQETSKVEIEQAKGGGADPGGQLTMSESVVETIAGLAARQIDGIHSLGKPRLFALGDSPTRGVAAEVGNKEAAIDIDCVIEYGCDLRDTARQLRELIAREVNRMAGREVVECNINVHDVHLPEEEEKKPKDEPRVR
ncbi:MAG: Asp23/Gls24 family envelope stress response protein [Polyangiales bacterium]